MNESVGRYLFPVALGGIAGLTFCVVAFALGEGTSLSPAGWNRNDSIPTRKEIDWAAGVPILLTIPKIGVNAAVEYVGLTPEGAMDVPKHQGNVGWFQLGPRPGEPGTAVIAGHYGIKNGTASVFDELHKLREGDAIYVRNDIGRDIAFFVREIRRFPPDATVPAVFTSVDEKSHLNLIACEGVWNVALKSYPYRLVIFTDKETEDSGGSVVIDDR